MFVCVDVTGKSNEAKDFDLASGNGVNQLRYSLHDSNQLERCVGNLAYGLSEKILSALDHRAVVREVGFMRKRARMPGACAKVASGCCEDQGLFIAARDESSRPRILRQRSQTATKTPVLVAVPNDDKLLPTLSFFVLRYWVAVLVNLFALLVLTCV